MRSKKPPDISSLLGAQQRHWEQSFSTRPSMFGDSPSAAARRVAAIYSGAGATRILELGAGQGRDSLLLAEHGFKVTSVDYSESATEALDRKARALAAPGSITALCHDVRRPLPFADGSFEACYSHMLYSMALTLPQLECLSAEIRRVLAPGALNTYTARHVGDPHFGTGTALGEGMYETTGGFIVRFFDRQTVERLAKGFRILDVEEFEEGELPRRLYLVTLKKKGRTRRER